MYEYRKGPAFWAFRAKESWGSLILEIGEAGSPTVEVGGADVLDFVRGLLQEAGVDAWVVERDSSNGTTTVVNSGSEHVVKVLHGGFLTPAVARQAAASLLADADEAERLQKESEEVDEEDVRAIQEVSPYVNRAEAEAYLRALKKRGVYIPRPSDEEEVPF